MIAQAAEGAPRGPRFAPTDASRAAQRTHLDRLRAIDHYPGCSFASANQLVAHVLGSPVLDLLAKERSDAAARGAGWLSYIGLAIGMLVLLVTPWVADEWAKTLGIPVAAPLALVLAVGGFALPLIYSRYFIMLGAGGAPAGSRNRVGYDALRENLGTGGPATHFYARWLTAFLDRVDRFFGDAGMADRTLFSHAFGLKMPAPLWTAPAFERCLLLALFYPIATILIMWVASGHVGPAEKVLGLPDVASWARGGAVALLGLSAIAFWRAARASRLTSFAWLASAFALAGGFANTGAYLDATTWAFAFTFAGAIAGTFFVPFAYAGAIAGIIAGAGAFAITFASVAPYLCRNHP